MQTGSSAPQAPTTPTPEPIVVTLPAAPATPLTSRDIAALRARRSELSSQLRSADNRRDGLAQELNGISSGPARAGLEQRIAVLDKRIVQIEADIAETGRQLTGASAGLASSEPWQFGLTSRNITTISNVFIIFVLAPLAIAAARNMWKKGSRPPPPPGAQENARRLDQLQQAVDAIAIEVERVSEGQRFVTKVLSDTSRVAIPATAENAPDSLQSSHRDLPR
ncbi:MAG: hypothetical protein ABI681_11595 [Gemmatimonadales bacterium]